MKLTLVMPSIGRKPGQGYITTWQMEPLVLALLAGLTPPEWEITIQDDRVEPIDYACPADLVGITVETYTARRAYQIAAQYRRRGVKVVMGGYHATLFSREVAEHADAVVVGEAEGIWGQVLNDAASGKLQKTYLSERSQHLLGIMPNRRVYAGKKYLPLTLVEFSRGCRHVCNECSSCRFAVFSIRRGLSSPENSFFRGSPVCSLSSALSPLWKREFAGPDSRGPITKKLPL